MLAFNALFPINPEVSLQDLLDLANKWIDESPQYQMRGELNKYRGHSEYKSVTGNECFEAISLMKDNVGYAGVRFRCSECDSIWTTEITFKKAESIWCSVKTDYQSTSLGKDVPRIHKPHFVKLIDKTYGFGNDYELEVASIARYLNTDDMRIAADIINGDICAEMPIVYISKANDGDYCIDSDKLARLLSGMAHVYVEPNRYFSFGLQSRTQGRNPYAGALGVFFPGSTRRVIIRPRSCPDGDYVGQSYVFDQIRETLNLLATPRELSFSTMMNHVRDRRHDELRQSSEKILMNISQKRIKKLQS